MSSTQFDFLLCSSRTRNIPMVKKNASRSWSWPFPSRFLSGYYPPWDISAMAGPDQSGGPWLIKFIKIEPRWETATNSEWCWHLFKVGTTYWRVHGPTANGDCKSYEGSHLGHQEHNKRSTVRSESRGESERQKLISQIQRHPKGFFRLVRIFYLRKYNIFKVRW